METINPVQTQPMQESGGLKGLVQQFSKFFLVGIMNTLIDLIILNLEMFVTGITTGPGYSIQKAVSFLFAVTFSYFINKHWTFQDKSKQDEGRKMSQFFAVSLVGMLINVGTASVVVNYLQAPINNFLNITFLTPQLWGTIGALCGTAIGLFWNFIGYKLWVFKK